MTSCDHDSNRHDHEHSCHIHSEDGAEPAVCSLPLAVPVICDNECQKTIEMITEKITEKIIIIRDWAKEKGFLIGHIKGLVSAPGQTVWFSCTGGEVNIRKSVKEDIPSGITAIIYGPDDAELSDFLNKVFPAPRT